jgi:hypothetical protein
VTDAKPRTPEEEERAFRIAIFKVLERIASALERAHPAPREQSLDLDGKYGDPKVRFKPRDWTGDYTKGQLCSSSPPELLDLYAQALEHFASKADDTADGQKKKRYDELDAARARAWAKRHRAGWKPASSPTRTGWEAPAIGSSAAPVDEPPFADTSDLDDEPIDEPI